MHNLLLIAAGGAVGALLRYAVSGVAHRLVGTAFPWGTLAVNLAGSLLIGVLWGLSERTPLPTPAAVFLFTGLLGAFTTFSTYTLECLHLLRAGETELALLYLGASNALGLLLVYAGYSAARLLATPS